MADLAILIDFGSTFTKVTAVDLQGRRIVARDQSPSTVATDVRKGLLDALVRLSRQPLNPASLHGDTIDQLLGDALVLATSSAAGGLRMAVVGNVPGLTLAAAHATALGAGAKIVGSFSFKLQDDDLDALRALAPDMILLTGGVDGGDQRTILHNAECLARLGLDAPIVVAGNTEAAAEISKMLSRAGLEFACVANVMPRIDALEAEEARREIQRLFLNRIVQSKGLDQLRERLSTIEPTPMAVFDAAMLIANGHGDRPGYGDLLLVDIGGATTDIHSIGFGKHSTDEIIPGGMQEPYGKRTVEGDLGVRINAHTIVERAGPDNLVAAFRRIFPEFDTAPEALLDYVRRVGHATHDVPTADWQYAADAVLARLAADIAIERHAGRLERYHARGGAIDIQSGKDLSETGLVIGTGGVFAHNPFGDRIIHCEPLVTQGRKVLRPASARILIDANYVMYAVGILARRLPDVALDIFENHFGAPNLPRFTATGIDDATTDHGETCACCSEWGGPSGWRLGNRSRK